MHLNPWFKWTSFKQNASCISSNSITSTCHVHASYCCICLCIDCRHCPFSIGPAPEVFESTYQWSSAPLLIYQASNPPCSFRYNPTLAPALFYCIRTTTIQLLLFCCGSWTYSSAWPVIATVTRWNPLACVGVDWAMFVFPTMLCLLCLESCQVWLIEVMN